MTGVTWDEPSGPCDCTEILGTVEVSTSLGIMLADVGTSLTVGGTCGGGGVVNKTGGGRGLSENSIIKPSINTQNIYKHILFLTLLQLYLATSF